MTGTMHERLGDLDWRLYRFSTITTTTGKNMSIKVGKTHEVTLALAAGTKKFTIDSIEKVTSSDPAAVVVMAQDKTAVFVKGLKPATGITLEAAAMATIGGKAMLFKAKSAPFDVVEDDGKGDPVLDASGNPVLDESGQPVTEDKLTLTIEVAA